MRDHRRSCLLIVLVSWGRSVPHVPAEIEGWSSLNLQDEQLVLTVFVTFIAVTIVTISTLALELPVVIAAVSVGVTVMIACSTLVEIYKHTT